MLVLKSGYNRIDTFPELKDWLEANYVRRVVRGDYRIFERNDSNGRLRSVSFGPG